MTTSIIFLFEGLMPALTSHTEAAKQGIAHLGYPAYFPTLLLFFKLPGALSLILPMVPARVKEWAYAGFAFSFLAASGSYIATDGVNGFAVFPLIILALLIVSYLCGHKLNKVKSAQNINTI